MRQVKLSALVAQSKELTTKAPKHVARTVSWWKEHYGSIAFLDAKSIEQTATQQLYRAIVENDIKTAKHLLEMHPQLSFIKVFGNGKRTALYVASCLAKVEIVRLLIQHGADKKLACDGYTPLQVAGNYVHDPLSTMKVKHLLGAFSCPQVLLVKKSTDKATTTRVHIHFSEPVCDFVQADLEMQGCNIISFTMYREDFFTVHLRLIDGTEPSVRIPPNVARRKHANRFNEASTILYLNK
ncbi:hypothetical protein Ae201684_009171 [Aphanomyces euteiches]|uniref:Uncharacterized protein n=1 Tax=Aphanomyces euteiches TaxID=100861 RepID=A0A6G0X278_9STRA|nr:hypothetical protein Ae201684_009171 [Aphanomyces euteiches]KAH9153022.1 hypothetical protein AeRB84_004655 [Aphanomyces euteiches]